MKVKMLGIAVNVSFAFCFVSNDISLRSMIIGAMW
jgi:hypothetical protein